MNVVPLHNPQDPMIVHMSCTQITTPPQSMFGIDIMEHQPQPDITYPQLDLMIKTYVDNNAPAMVRSILNLTLRLPLYPFPLNIIHTLQDKAEINAREKNQL